MKYFEAMENAEKRYIQELYKNHGKNGIVTMAKVSGLRIDMLRQKLLRYRLVKSRRVGSIYWNQKV